MDFTPENFNAIAQEVQRLREERNQATNAYDQLLAQFQELQAAVKQSKDHIELLKGSSDGKHRVQTTNLLKAKEPVSFTNKSSYSIWVESIKADLVPLLPELKQFFRYAEEFPSRHRLTLEERENIHH